MAIMKDTCMHWITASDEHMYSSRHQHAHTHTHARARRVCSVHTYRQTDRKTDNQTAYLHTYIHTYINTLHKCRELLVSMISLSGPLLFSGVNVDLPATYETIEKVV